MTFVDWRSMHSVTKVLKKDMSKLVYLAPKDWIEHARGSRILTVHLYPMRVCAKHPKRLLEKSDAIFHQLYLAGSDDTFVYSHGSDSGSNVRENHNTLIDLFCADEQMRKDAISAVIVSFKGEPIAYKFKEGYSYVNHSLGENYHRGIEKRVRSLKLPYSKLVFESLETKVMFHDQLDTIVCSLVHEDIIGRDFARKYLDGHRIKR